MVYKLHGSPMSTCTQRVLISAQALGVDVELVPVDLMKGEHKAEEFVKHQPFGQVPYLEDTEAGITFHESRAIARYLAAKAAPTNGLYPNIKSDDYYTQLARFETAASIEYANFDPMASKIVRELFFKPVLFKQPAGDASQLITDLNRFLDGYEAILSKQAYIAGDKLTLADLFHVPYGNLLFNQAGQGQLLESRPAFAAWWKKIIAEPAVQKIIGA